MVSFDVIIIGGSYAGLSAAMSLGRSLRKVLIIDSGLPCNRQTPHSHNFITHDGDTPKAIAEQAKAQVLAYERVSFHNGIAISGTQHEEGFEITTQAGESFTAKKVIFATGIRDLMPGLPGFAACWGISVIHCPYCHGYEYKAQATGILANGDMAFHYAPMISNLTKELTIFTNGKPAFSDAQSATLRRKKIAIIDKEIEQLKHREGQLQEILFTDGSSAVLNALYARPAFEQHCQIPEQLGCVFNEQGYIQVDNMQKTSIPGLFACGDNVTPMRSVASAVAMGNMAGAMANKELCEEAFV